MTADPEQRLQRLLDEAPHVRLLARSLLAEEADEVVQQTWLQAVQHGGRGVEQPRPWLSRIVRNVARNLHRSKTRRRAHEAKSHGLDGVPSSAELAEREEQRRRLVAATDRLPPALRAVVVLRFFEGQAPREIAERLGLPPTTVWNRNRQAMQLLRAELDGEFGSRAAWAGPLAILLRESTPVVPMPAGPAATSATSNASTLSMGVIAMTAKTKVAAAAAVMLAVAGAVVWWQVDPGAPSSTTPPTATDTASAAAGSLDSPSQRVAVPSRTDRDHEAQRDAMPAPAAATTESLIVNAFYAEDKKPAAGLTMLLRTGIGDHRFGVARQRTDSTGRAVFADLPLETFTVITGRGGELGVRVQITPGGPSEIDYPIPSGMDVSGIVTDIQGVPIAGATIEVAPFARSDLDPQPTTKTGADGKFALRDLPTQSMVGARAHGYTASQLAFVSGQAGGNADVRLELGPNGGSVDGAVFDPLGRPVAGAFVRIGEGRITGITAGLNGGPPLPALVRTDADGRFVAIGIPEGSQPVEARAAGLAPWKGNCEVAASMTVPLRIDLGRGCTIRGTVTSAAGPVARAEISVGGWQELAHYNTVSASDGTFEITGLAPGECEVKAEHHDLGKAVATVTTSPHITATCDLSMGRGLELRGTVQNMKGEPIRGATIECHSAGDARWFGHERSNREGHFAIPNCPPGHPVSIRVRKNRFAPAEHNDVDPTAGILAVRLQELPPASVHITGIVQGPDGAPIANARVFAFGPEGSSSNSSTRTKPDGSFELGPVVPGPRRLSVRIPEYPRYLGIERDLPADARWDAGVIQLSGGGKARLTATGNIANVKFYACHPDWRTAGRFSAQGSSLLSDPLAPGEYRLRIAGGTATTPIVPFTVIAGQVTEVAVELQTGVEQAIECDVSALPPAATSIQFVILRGGQQITSHLTQRKGKMARASFQLSPGDYSVQAFAGNRRIANAPFSVGASQGPPVQVTAQ